MQGGSHASCSSAQLSEEAGSLKCCMAPGEEVWAGPGAQVRVNERAKLRTELVTKILFSTL